MKIHQPWSLAIGLAFLVAAGLKLVLGHGDASDRELLTVLGVVWCVAAFRRPGPLIPARWHPSKQPDDYR
jgi:hypothetical protein